MREECGIFGIWGHEPLAAARLTYLGLFALQHRGQESAGITSLQEGRLKTFKGMGLVSEVFLNSRLDDSSTTAAIGHVRYSTTGTSILENAQPISVTYAGGQLAAAHNGNLVNADTLRESLEKQGAAFQTTSDSEVIIQLIVNHAASCGLQQGITQAISSIKGAYALILLTNKELIGIRDEFGFRPLCIGRLNDSFVLASESCALDIIGAEYIRDVEPGEMVIINHSGLTSRKPERQPKKYKQCIFEYIYFSRPDSKVFGRSVYEVRKRSGQQLAIESPVSADIVIPIPDSGVSAALGYAEGCGLKYELGLIRNHYVGRTFLNPKQSIREFGVSIKLNPVKEVVADKRVILVDDSIVRGTTCKKIISMVRNAGAKEVHLRISSPPIKYPCFYGVDTPTTKELIAATHSLEETRDFIGVDSLGYLSLEGLLTAALSSKENNEFCTACFDGEYPHVVRG
ncbi:amidophosphoribosyltransferase [Candidatus Desantisbacteria bacterium CG2_30_40_21]|uniref:Amidophosphoribosyltransferase n=4 Tax=unclassified Candidatus Desantisiibacteriota TaxID=3106372 RepID=A0A2M7P399_9BACT|nr:MAG: amidophosphoribosyltransferase [Candidatus Desantisbacteria bacterium CG2_30_40_21]PIP41542.1 MAG: amidophosphoribosyltransferase [Candidatus Desantisbacteria bacterium CG23_combo_of_CG06-09_8_20_14_all_40_23]PIY19768.1 MAG: amidophosphoribosyltransferase [Candidatus Desantisbacteria bacterium CG_4_10_14_3_um_filter_40_18]PJB29529.1 MAG: amidophosphoribosyltransferase [Candidatus Desantisbacteria bacterium CG_4_9_14_3_um_filter_40_11]